MSDSWRPHGLYYISPPVSSICGLLQARTLGWVASPLSRGSSPPRDGSPVSRSAGRLCRRSHEGSPVCTGHLATPTSPQAWAEVAHGMRSPQKYKLPGSSEDTLPGPGDPWQLGSDSICGCALHWPQQPEDCPPPSVSGIKRHPVTGGGVTQYKNTRLMALNIFFSAQLLLQLQNLAVHWSIPQPLQGFRQSLSPALHDNNKFT